MTQGDLYRAKLELHRVCIIIPTYNNAKTLGTVIADVAAYSNDIIVVNDGSTDETQKILSSYSFVHIISYKKNVGKGWALRKGFAYAAERGYKYAVTIDSDGQHFAKDLPKFIDTLETVNDSIIIGARNMEQESVPGKSSLATSSLISGLGSRQVLVRLIHNRATGCIHCNH